MIKRSNLLSVLILLIGHASSSIAQEVELFGLSNQDLARLFLEEAIEIARSSSVTRDPFANHQGQLEELGEFKVLQEAYRTDPEATLALIDRILKAGRGQ